MHSPNILCINRSIFTNLVKIPYTFKWHTNTVLLKFLHRRKQTSVIYFNILAHLSKIQSKHGTHIEILKKQN